MLKGTDRQHAGAIAFLVRVFGSRSTAGRVATPQDLSVTKQHRNDRWHRCTASAGDWQIITTTSHRSANQRYFMHNSTTVHRMRMQSSALDSSRSQLCNDTSTGVVRHQITKWRRLQKVVSYDVLHHIIDKTKILQFLDCNDFAGIIFTPRRSIDRFWSIASVVAFPTLLGHFLFYGNKQGIVRKILKWSKFSQFVCEIWAKMTS